MHFCSIEYGWSKQGENPAIPDLSGERHGGHQLAEKNSEWTFQLRTYVQGLNFSLDTKLYTK